LISFQRLYEERVARSTARAQAVVVRQVGKQVMFRSAPPQRRKREVVTTQQDDDADDIRKFFT
jgi:hypothetical protein